MAITRCKNPDVDMDWRRMLSHYANAQASSHMQEQMGMFYTYYEQLQGILSRQHVLCLMEPVEIK